MEVEIIRDRLGFLALQSSWESLEKEYSIFSSFEWNLLWWNNFGKGKELFVIVVKKKGEVVGIAPFMRITTFFRKKTIKFIGYPHADYCDILAKDNNSEVIEAALNFLIAHKREWDVFWIEEVPSNSSTLRVLEASRLPFPFAGSSMFCNECYSINFSDRFPETFKKVLTKRDLLRCIRSLKQDGTLAFKEVTHSKEIEDAVEILIDQHRKQWRAKKEVSIFEKANARGFIRDLVYTGIPQKKVSLCTLCIDQKVIAIQLGFFNNTKFTTYLQTYDLRYAKKGPGRISHKFLIEHFVKKGMQCLDMTRGAEDYKLRLANQKRINRGFCLDKNPLRYVSKKILFSLRGFVIQRPSLHENIKSILKIPQTFAKSTSKG